MTGVGPLRSVPSMATSRNGAPATQADIGPLSVLTIRIRARRPGGTSTGTSVSLPLMVRTPS